MKDTLFVLRAGFDDGGTRSRCASTRIVGGHGGVATFADLAAATGH